MSNTLAVDTDVPKLLDELKREKAHGSLTLHLRAGEVDLVRLERTFLTHNSHLINQGENRHGCKKHIR